MHPDATTTQIRQAYLRTARRWHPDKVHPADKELANRRFQEVAEAYEVLNDQQERRIYYLYLRCLPFGYMEVADPEDPMGHSMQVPVRGWADFRRKCDSVLLANGWPDPSARQYWDDGGGDVDPPVSALEWIAAGSVAVALWWFVGWRHQRRVWLETMPALIWHEHVDYIVPLSLRMSLFFFGNVHFREAAGFV